MLAFRMVLYCTGEAMEGAGGWWACERAGIQVSQETGVPCGGTDLRANSYAIAPSPRTSGGRDAVRHTSFPAALRCGLWGSRAFIAIG